ncbi:SDR family NAD(P)-dependent oxidoreductase [Streptomyces sulphureus]|uniref:SDR family NAD(P)-dependent oxidoreductase n=1 Tax=Streptomyces sulphureus TaxID=47758 RepID=UPI000361BC07|nr:SDR family oxidoreductase [Streptomyces sulphureus]
MPQLDGKIAIVTGSTAGMGARTAEALALAGAHVVVSGRNTERGAAVVEDIQAKGGRAEFVAADVVREEDVARLVEGTVERHGRLDAAFNNAGGGGAFGPIDKVPREAYDAVLAVNLTGTFLCLKYEVAAMKAAGGGSIVNNASTAGVQGTAFGLAAYTAAKHGVVGLTKAAALEAGPAGVRVNALITGPVDTADFRKRVEGQPGAVERAGAGTALGRICTEDEVAAAVAFLAGDESSFVTGSFLGLDGGMTAGVTAGMMQRPGKG